MSSIDEYKTIAIVGQPNAGKSTLYNVLSDIKTSTSNFSGTSVQVTECLINVLGDTYRLIDLPGTYSLNPEDSAEKVTTDFLINNKVDFVINVLDGTLLARSLELTIELLEFRIPLIIALNMHDEAKDKGLLIDPDALSKIVGVDVIPITALFAKGVKQLIEACDDKIRNGTNLPNVLKYTKHIENKITELSEELKPLVSSMQGSERFYAIKALENPDIIPIEIADAAKEKRKRFEDEILTEHNTDIFEAISYERHHLAMKIAEKISKFVKKNNTPFLIQLDKFLLHPIFGYVALLIFHLFLFGTIYFVGNFLAGLVQPGLDFISSLYAPLKANHSFWWYTIDGLYQGLAGGIGIVLPYFLPLLLLTSFFEETGYIARIAFLVDGFMHKIGLHGKSVAAFVLGIGCNVPALYATRILDNKRDRLLTALLIPFVPCSARIAVIFALTAVFAGPIWTVVIYLFVLFVIAINGKVLSKFLQKPMGLIMEMPDLKNPNLNITVKKTYYKLQDFVREAFPYLVLGSILLNWVEYMQLSEYLNYIFSPMMNFVLGLPEKLGSTLIFGFLRKELILVMASQAMGVTDLSQMGLSLQQVIVFIIFVTLYFPCLTTFVVLWKEFGQKIAWLSVAMSMVIATISAYAFKLMFELYYYLF